MNKVLDYSLKKEFSKFIMNDALISLTLSLVAQTYSSISISTKGTEKARVFPEFFYTFRIEDKIKTSLLSQYKHEIAGGRTSLLIAFNPAR